MDRDAAVLVAGARTLGGAALVRVCRERGFTRVHGEELAEDAWADAVTVDALFEKVRPEYVFMAAGASGGIQENVDHPATLMRDNLLASCNVIHAAWRHDVRKLLYLASSCTYPRECPQPMRESMLHTGPLEPTNQAYALAKLAGIELCAAYRREHGAPFIAAIPANLFGPGEPFSTQGTHVVPALLRRMHDAKEAGRKEVVLWGTGAPRREFLYADDAAGACLMLMERYDEEGVINIAGGETVSIAELAEIIRKTVGYEGKVRFDPSKPDGMPIKQLDSRRIAALGWKPATPLDQALAETYRDCLHRETPPA